MSIPDALTAAALAGGVAANLATKVVEHHLRQAEGTRFGTMLKRHGLIEPNLGERLAKAIEDALTLFQSRYPQYAVTAVASFFRDNRVAALIGDAILHGTALDQDDLAAALRQHFGADWVSNALYRRDELQPDQVVSLFLSCYDEVLQRHLTESDLAILKVLRELRGQLAATEQRLEAAIARSSQEQMGPLADATHTVQAAAWDVGEKGCGGTGGRPGGSSWPSYGIAIRSRTTP
ncbi:MAG: hypothetical protein ACRDI2_15000 [Chloroflexota bacterium]